MPRIRQSAHTIHTPFSVDAAFRLGLGHPSPDSKSSLCLFCLSFGFDPKPTPPAGNPAPKRRKAEPGTRRTVIRNHSSSQVKTHHRSRHSRHWPIYSALVAEIVDDPSRCRAEARAFFPDPAEPPSPLPTADEAAVVPLVSLASEATTEAAPEATPEAAPAPHVPDLAHRAQIPIPIGDSCESDAMIAAAAAAAAASNPMADAVASAAASNPTPDAVAVAVASNPTSDAVVAADVSAESTLSDAAPSPVAGPALAFAAALPTEVVPVNDVGPGLAAAHAANFTALKAAGTGPSVVGGMGAAEVSSALAAFLIAYDAARGTRYEEFRVSVLRAMHNNDVASGALLIGEDAIPGEEFVRFVEEQFVVDGLSTGGAKALLKRFMNGLVG